MRLLTFLIFTGLVFGVSAQNDVITKADFAFEQGKYAEAFEWYQEAGELYLAANEFELYTLCNLKMAQCHLKTGDLSLVVSQCQHITDYLEDILPAASGLSVSTRLLQAEALLKLGQYEPMMETLQKAELELDDPESLLAAECYNDLGVAYWNNKNKVTARAYHEKALAIRQKMLTESDPLIADSYLNLGLIAMEADFLESVVNFNRALGIYKQAFGVNSPQVALCYSNLSLANRNQKNFEEALTYLDETMKIWKANYVGDHPNKAFTLSNRGRILQDQGRLNEALVVLQQALQMYLRLYGEKHPEVANTHYLIGAVQMDTQAYKNAVESFQKSIYANLSDQYYQELLDLPKLENYFNADILLFSLEYKARALEALHFEKTLNPKDIKASLATYLLCDDLISTIRQLRLTEADKIELGKINTDIYESGIRIALYLSEKTFKKDHYKAMAFTFCERSKSSVLLEAIHETKARSFAGIPDDLLVYEDSLKNKISRLEQQLAENPEEPMLATYKGQLFDAQLAYRNFINELEDNYPNYYKLKYRQPDIEIAQLQQRFQSTDGLLSYFIGDSLIYSFLVTRDDIAVTTFQRNKDLNKWIKGYRNGIKYKISDAYKPAARQLYKQLIPAIPGNITDIVIIPDGVLGTVPFEALVNRENGVEKYLVQQYAISYDYAASLLLDKSRMSINYSRGILLAAPVEFENNLVNMASLPGTEQEVREIKYLFLTGEEEPKTLLRSEASEAALKSSALANYRYLHFATHGIVNESQPELSCIFATPNTDEDGSLYSGEIYNLKINADLVTLSACETGLGKVTKGEGIIGLSRALMYAGARNLVVSLWQVSDASTADLMIEFYRQHLHLADEPYFSQSLRKAKLSLLGSEDFHEPYYWAPFILIGR